jgi:hypothetical protein
MFPHPTCTKETRTTNQKRQDSNFPQQSIVQSPPLMGYSQHTPMFHEMNSPSQFYHQQQNQQQHPDQFLRTMSSSVHQPMAFQHEHYMMDPFSNNIRNQNQSQQMIDRVQQNTRDIGKSRFDAPVQQSFQTNYFMQNYESLNHISNQRMENDMNLFVDRNPVNQRRDNIEKTRLQDRREFMNTQGGNLHNFADLTPQYTRKERHNVNTSKYVPMAKTLALPKDKI